MEYRYTSHHNELLTRIATIIVLVAVVVLIVSFFIISMSMNEPSADAFLLSDFTDALLSTKFAYSQVL